MIFGPFATRQARFIRFLRHLYAFHYTCTLRALATSFSYSTTAPGGCHLQSARHRVQDSIELRVEVVNHGTVEQTRTRANGLAAGSEWVESPCVATNLRSAGEYDGAKVTGVLYRVEREALDGFVHMEI